MIRTLKKGVGCINSLCENFPRFTTFYDEKGNRVNGGVCRLFLKNEMGEYTIPTPFFGFWSGDFAGEHSFWTPIVNKLDIEEYYKLSIAGDCVHNFINFRQENTTFAVRDNKMCRNDEKYKFYEPVIARNCEFYCEENNNLFCVEFDGRPIYPDILFSDFIYSVVFNFGKEGWKRFFDIVGKCVFVSSPRWGVVEQNGKFGNRFWDENIHVEHIVKSLIKVFNMGGIILDNSKRFRDEFESMCDYCWSCECPDKSLDELGRWLVSKGYQLNEIEKLYCHVNAFGDNGEMHFERGFGYDFAEIAFALLGKEGKNE